MSGDTPSRAVSVRGAGQAVVMQRVGGTQVPQKTNPQCHVCMSPVRMEAEEEILLGVAFRRINERLPEGHPVLSYDSLRRHWKNDMGLEDSETVNIVHRRARQIGRRISDYEGSLVDGITLLEVVVQKSFEQIAKGTIQPTVRDGIAAAKTLAELGEYDDASLDQQTYVEAFSIYQDEARRIMGEKDFAAFGDALAGSPVLAALVARYNGEGGEDGQEGAESDPDGEAILTSEDS